MKRLLLSLFLTSIAFSLFAALPCNGAIHHGLAIGLTSNETIQQIKASDFFISLDPNCNEIVGISFSPTDINDTHKTVDCSNLNDQIINIFITDTDGNQVSVETYFHVTDEINTCNGGSSASCQSNLTIKEGLAVALSNTNEATLHVNNCIKKEEENCLEDYVVQFDATNETEIHFNNPSLGIQNIDINLAFNNYPLNQIRTSLTIQSPLSTFSCIPVPIVYYGLATTLDNSGLAELDAALFDTGSYSDCGGEVVLSFSESIIDTLRTFYCANLGVEFLDIWITDMQTGTQNKVETYVFVQGIQEICTDCPQELFLSSQAEVNAFGINHPTCDTIPGNVHIFGADITNLSPLAGITYIGGSLTIVECASLTTLEALSNLTQVDDNISIYNNQMLPNCSISIICSYLANGGTINFSNNATGCNSAEEVLVPPTIIPNLTPRMIGEDINLTLTAQDLDNGSFGACGSMVNLSISQTSFSCQDVGTTQLLITATDDYGNMSEMMVDLEITDPEEHCTCDGMTLSSNDQPLIEGAFLAMETIESEAIIDISKKVVYHAGESILLTPGFHAKAGSNFTIQIGTCVNPGELTNTMPADATNHKIGINSSLAKLNESLSLKVSPNPFQRTTTIHYTLTHTSKISLALYDINGRLVDQLEQNLQKDIGQHNYYYQAPHLGEGMYFLVLQSEQESLVKKIAILK